MDVYKAYPYGGWVDCVSVSCDASYKNLLDDGATTCQPASEEAGRPLPTSADLPVPASFVAWGDGQDVASPIETFFSSLGKFLTPKTAPETVAAATPSSLPKRKHVLVKKQPTALPTTTKDLPRKSEVIE